MIELGLRKSATKKTKPHLAKYVDADNIKARYRRIY